MAELLEKIEPCDKFIPFTLDDENTPHCGLSSNSTTGSKCLTLICKQCHPERTVKYCRKCCLQEKHHT